jgi:hypothetical protein
VGAMRACASSLTSTTTLIVHTDFERADQMCWRPGTSTDESETYIALRNMLPRAFPGFGDDLFDASCTATHSHLPLSCPVVCWW